LAETALRTRLARHTPSPASLGESYDCLGLIDLAQDDLPAARQEIEHALELRRKAFPLENDSIALSYNHLGEVLIAQHDFDGAQQTYAEALRIARKNFPDAPHPITAEALYGMGMALFMQGNTPGATAALNASLKMRQRLYPAGHPAIQKTAQALQSIEKRAPGRTTQGRSDLLQRMGQ
jgi:tetratricopeptide (TPR) repeat protein